MTTRKPKPPAPSAPIHYGITRNGRTSTVCNAAVYLTALVTYGTHATKDERMVTCATCLALVDGAK